MAIEQEFLNAKERVTKLPQKPDSSEMLSLYSFYKQATEGDVSGKKPSMIDFVAKAKYQAWEEHKGMSKEDAMKGYVALVKELEEKYKA